jgi:AcrR family transcriptional regulator
MRGRPTSIREDDILDAARAVFLARGLDATTAEIAARAGISESLIFYRYKTKEALLVAVIDRQIAVPPLFEALAERVGRGELADHLFEIGAAIIEAMQTFLPLMMMAWSSPVKLTVLHERLKHPNPVQIRMIRLLSGYFEAEARRGRLRRVDPEILARGFFGGVCDYVMSRFLHHTEERLPLGAQTFLRSWVQILLDGARVRRQQLLSSHSRKKASR